MRLLVCEGQQRCQYGQSGHRSLEIESGLTASYNLLWCVGLPSIQK